MSTSQSKSVPEPWKSFLDEIDAAISSPLRLDCLGGFVVTLLYGMSRASADIDVFEIAPSSVSRVVMQVAMQGGTLHRKYGLYLDRVTVAFVPEDYESRLIEMFPGAFKHLRLMALDPYDLALSKLERNTQKDRDDVSYLARTIPFDLDILQERYETEFRWQLGNPTREDLTLRLWMEVIREERMSETS